MCKWQKKPIPIHVTTSTFNSCSVRVSSRITENFPSSLEQLNLKSKIIWIHFLFIFDKLFFRKGETEASLKKKVIFSCQTQMKSHEIVQVGPTDFHFFSVLSKPSTHFDVFVVVVFSSILFIDQTVEWKIVFAHVNHKCSNVQMLNAWIDWLNRLKKQR